MPLTLILAIAIAWACGYIATRKHRNRFGWMVLGALFGPIALLAVALFPRRRTAEPSPSVPLGPDVIDVTEAVTE